MRKIQTMLWKEPLLSVSAVLVLITSVFVKPSLRAIDWKVLVILFNLMLVISALEKYKVLDRISVSILNNLTSARNISLCLVFLTGVFAMFVTNDVALLSMVPLTLLIAKRGRFNPAWIIIYQTLAANIGSSLTPMGNPQNLFLYEHFQIKNMEFVSILFPFVLIGFITLFIVTLQVPAKPVRYKVENEAVPVSRWKQIFYLVLFGIVLLSIVRFLDYGLVFTLLVGIFLVLDRELFRKIDYCLLATFIAFFIFVDNFSRLPGVTGYICSALAGQERTFFLGILSSQVISNVPAAILLANFSGNYRELLWGVNVGGLGTLIASLASLISYKLYRKEFPESNYLLKFHLVNFGGLAFFTAVIHLYNSFR